MFSVGEKLYRLTERDMETLFMDPLYRKFDQAYIATQATASTIIQIPGDRCLYLHNVQCNLPAVVGDAWTAVVISLFNSNGTINLSRLWAAGDTAGVIGDNSSTRGVNVQVNLSKQFQMLLPPQTQLEVLTLRAGTLANVATASISFQGLLIPPGGIGRGG